MEMQGVSTCCVSPAASPRDRRASACWCCMGARVGAGHVSASRQAQSALRQVPRSTAQVCRPDAAAAAQRPAHRRMSLDFCADGAGLACCGAGVVAAWGRAPNPTCRGGEPAGPSDGWLPSIESALELETAGRGLAGAASSPPASPASTAAAAAAAADSAAAVASVAGPSASLLTGCSSAAPLLPSSSASARSEAAEPAALKEAAALTTSMNRALGCRCCSSCLLSCCPTAAPSPRCAGCPCSSTAVPLAAPPLPRPAAPT